MPRQGLLEASGAVLGRVKMGEGGLWLTLFLKGYGITRASAPGAESGRVRFGGGTEPFVWGSFRLHKGRAGGFYLNGVDITDDMIGLRGRPDAVYAAVHWSRLLTKLLMPENPSDMLLANLYWNMKLLSNPIVPKEAAEWRFLWRWLSEWGLAPDMTRCSNCLTSPRTDQKMAWTDDGFICQNCDIKAQNERPSFSGSELALLYYVAGHNADSTARLFSERGELKKYASVFAVAARCAESVLLNEK